MVRNRWGARPTLAAGFLWLSLSMAACSVVQNTEQNTDSASLNLRIVPGKSKGFASNEVSGNPPSSSFQLLNEYCYALVVSQDSPEFDLGPLRSAADSNLAACDGFPRRLGKSFGLFAKGETFESSFRAYRTYRFELIGVLKTPSISGRDAAPANCSGDLRAEFDPAGGPYNVVFKHNGEVKNFEAKLIASNEVLISPGTNNIDLEAYDSPAGVNPKCERPPTTATVTSISAEGAARAVKEGAEIDIDINFSEPVTATAGTLVLNTVPKAQATYLSGSGTSQLVFRYTVAASELSTALNYESITSLVVPTSTPILAVSSSLPASLSLPEPTLPDSMLGGPQIVVDTEAPSAPSISIDGGANYATSTSVTLTLSAAGGAPTEMYITNTSGCGSGGAWETFSASKAWTLGQINATATVYAKFRDAASNESSCASDTIIHNNSSPTPGSFSINAGSDYTSSTSVNLSMSATGSPAEMYITNTAGCASGGTWIAYTTTNAGWTIAQTNGTATVYIKYRNAALSESACVNDTIVHDNIPPSTPTVQINSGNAAVTVTTINLDLSASGTPAEMYITNTAGCGSAGAWETFNASKSWVLGSTNQTVFVYVKFRDAALNESSCASDSIIHDTVAPTWSSAPTHASTYASASSSPSISFSANASDGGSGVLKYQYALGTGTNGAQLDDIAAWTDTPSNPPSNPFTASSLSLAGGFSYYVSMRAVDVAGNNSGVLNSTGWIADVAPALLPSTNGVVNALVRLGNILYMGGAFTRVGDYAGYGSPVHTTSGALPTATLNAVNGPVYAAVSDGSSGWYIGGAFSKVGADSRANIARINSDGSVNSSFTKGTDGAVYALLLNGSYLHAGGAFNRVDATSSEKIAAVYATTGAIAYANPYTVNGAVRAIALSGTDMYIGGDFTQINGAYQYRVANMHATNYAQYVQSAWSASTSFNAEVTALAYTGTTLYVGGNFTDALGDANHDYLVAVDTSGGTGGIVSGFAGTANNWVGSLVLNGSTLYVGGNFTQLSGISRSYVGALSSSTGSVELWNPGADGTVYSMSLSGTTLYLGGSFSNAGGAARSGIAALATASDTALSWNPSLGNTVYSLAVGGSQVYVGSNAPIMANASARMTLAAVDLRSGALTSWNPGTNNAVYAMATDGSQIVVGGNFSWLGGSGNSRSSLGSVYLSGAVTSWNPGADSNVYALAIDSAGYVYAGGNFANLGGAARTKVGKLSVGSNAALSWNPGADGDVYALAVDGSRVYLGGAFSHVSLTARSNFAAVDTTNGTLNSLALAVNGAVKAMAIDGTELYLGGTFSTVASVTHNRIAKIDLASNIVADWSPSITGTSVKAITVVAGVAYVGGNFTATGTVTTRQSLAAFDRSAATTTWDPGVGSASTSTIFALASGGTNQYIGGLTNMIGTKSESNLGVVMSSGASP